MLSTLIVLVNIVMGVQLSGELGWNLSFVGISDFHRDSIVCLPGPVGVGVVRWDIEPSQDAVVKFGLRVMDFRYQSALSTPDPGMLSSVYVDEMVLYLYDFALEGLDIGIGKQRVGWGCADFMSVIDNINPILAVPGGISSGMDYLGVYSIVVDYTLPLDIEVQSLFLPFFASLGVTQDVMDWGFSKAFSDASMPFNIRDVDVEFVPPERFSDGIGGGVRLGKTILDVDVYLSYLNHVDPVPYTRRRDIYEDGTIDVEFGYHREEVFGVEMGSVLWDIGIRGEAAYFVPEVAVCTTVVRMQAGVFRRTEYCAGSPYWKFTLGADYDFGDGWYANAEFIRGIIGERMEYVLRNYGFLVLRKEWNEKWQTTATMLTDFGEEFDFKGIIGGVGVDYKVCDDVDLMANVMAIEGDSAKWAVMDGEVMLGFGMKVAF